MNSLVNWFICSKIGILLRVKVAAKVGSRGTLLPVDLAAGVCEELGGGFKRAEVHNRIPAIK